jgi:hypothetical protein
MKILIPFIIVILVSCSPVKRFNRLIDKYPYLVQTETITIHDTVEVIVPEVKHDTSFIDKTLYDTVYVDKDRLKIKLWKVFDTLYVEGECETDTVTVVREVEIPVKYYESGKWWHKIPWWVYLLAATGLVDYLYKRFRKSIFPEN